VFDNDEKYITVLKGNSKLWEDVIILDNLRKQVCEAKCQPMFDSEEKGINMLKGNTELFDLIM
jgi:hypothetical protein